MAKKAGSPVSTSPCLSGGRELQTRYWVFYQFVARWRWWRDSSSDNAELGPRHGLGQPGPGGGLHPPHSAGDHISTLHSQQRPFPLIYFFKLTFLIICLFLLLDEKQTHIDPEQIRILSIFLTIECYHALTKTIFHMEWTLLVFVWRHYYNPHYKLVNLYPPNLHLKPQID